MPKHSDFYHIPTAINQTVASEIINQMKDEELQDALLLDGSKDGRVSQLVWIPTDNWVAGMMAHFINCANTSTFGYDLTNWSDKIQYTVYDGKGSNYFWHIDNAQSDLNPEWVRKLSISLCLSSKDDYEGGEFQLLLNGQMYSYKMDIGEAFIFPSDCTHRIRPLKSGKRISLVGWYGGPPFR